ncbi:NADH-quinone oxidoreductase subunit H [Klenkia sp. LSe6-5]|uniref:NADH-quinone oxidoreductase subunit H n=1 Tax=Klenkia sesuvii TaxID=3103137 RepID=A0ABU8DU16_9ACTN
MGEVTAVGTGWVPLAAAVLLATTAVTATADGALLGRPDRPWAEAARLLRQQRRTTLAADTLLGRGAVLLAPVVALLMVAVVPLGTWTVADLGVGVVWFNALDVVLWAVFWLAGWGANSALALVGAYRFLAQALAYELPLMFALAAPAVAAQSLRLGDVVAAQQGLWFVVWMPAAFAVYCTGVLGFTARGPFAAPVSADVAGGLAAELSGVDRLLLAGGRWLLLVAGAAFGVTAFLGGGGGPLLPGWLWVLVKTVLLSLVLAAVARRLPLWRADRFTEVGWLVLLPVALLQLLVVAVVEVL